MKGDEVKKIRYALSEAVGRRMSQHDLAAVLGLTGSTGPDTLRSWEDGSRDVSGPGALALRYLSQGLPGFRGDVPEWSYQREFHHDHANVIVRHWWPRFVVNVKRPSTAPPFLDTPRWIDDPLFRREAIVAACCEAFRLPVSSPARDRG